MRKACSITGAAKAVLDFARQASCPASGWPRAEVSIAVFSRGRADNDNRLTRAPGARNSALDVVSGRHAFDFEVIRRLRAMLERHQPDIVWTNALKSHLIARILRVPRRAGWIAFRHGYTATTLRVKGYNQVDRAELSA